MGLVSGPLPGAPRRRQRATPADRGLAISDGLKPMVSGIRPFSSVSSIPKDAHIDQRKRILEPFNDQAQ